MNLLLLLLKINFILQTVLLYSERRNSGLQQPLQGETALSYRNMCKTFLTRTFWNLTARDLCEDVRTSRYMYKLSFPMYMARFELLCIYQFFHTHYMFPGGKRQGHLEGRGFTGGNKGCMKLNPAGQWWGWRGAGMLASVQKGQRLETCGAVGAGMAEARLGHS